MKYSAAKTIVRRHDNLQKKIQDARRRLGSAEESFGVSQREKDAAQLIEWYSKVVAEHEAAIEAYKEGIRRAKETMEAQKAVLVAEEERRVQGKKQLEEVRREVAELEDKLSHFTSKIDTARARVEEHDQKLALRKVKAEKVDEPEGTLDEPQVEPEETPAVVAVTVQVNGKQCGIVNLKPDADRDTAVAAAYALESVKEAIGDTPIKYEYYVPGRLINFSKAAFKAAPAGETQ